MAGKSIHNPQSSLICYRRIDVSISRSGFGKFPKILVQRLDINSRPAPLVESIRDRIFKWVSRPDIDVEAPLYVAQRAPQDNVLVVLSIGNERHKASSCSSDEISHGQNDLRTPLSVSLLKLE